MTPAFSPFRSGADSLTQIAREHARAVRFVLDSFYFG
jgi:hypothetical protein